MSNLATVTHLRPSQRPVAVSYTHLDVYKRQLPLVQERLPYDCFRHR